MSLRPLAVVAVLLGLLAAGGCTLPVDSHSEFIGERLDWKPLPGEPTAYVWRAPGTPPAGQSVLIDPITVFMAPTSPYRGIQPDEAKIITDYFHRAIAVELADDYTLTDRPGPGVLRLRVAITEIRRRRPDTTATYRPTRLALSGERQAPGEGVLSEEQALGTSSYFMGGTLEAEWLDAATGERLLAYREPRRRDQQDPATWAEVRTLLDEWARRLRDLPGRTGEAPAP